MSMLEHINSVCLANSTFKELLDKFKPKLDDGSMERKGEILGGIKFYVDETIPKNIMVCKDSNGNIIAIWEGIGS